MRLFITGFTGFAGFHLTEYLLAEGHQVAGLYHEATSHQPLPEDDAFVAVQGNLLDLAGLKTAVQTHQPDVIYHLAGQAYPARSWQDPAATLAINSGGTANLLEAARCFGRPKVVIVTSAEMYGPLQPEQVPVTETSEPAPHHPYGVSKLAASQLGQLYWQRYQLPVVEARPFNHIGPRQAAGFVVPDFASQLAAIKLEQRPAEMMVGDLSPQRDFTDVRDVIRAYHALAEKGQPGQTYLICSGRPVPIQLILDTLIELAGVEVMVRQDPARTRPSDTPISFGSYHKIQQDTGWQPHIPLRQSLADALADWLVRLDDGAA